MADERTSPGSTEDITAPAGDPVENARAAVEAHVAGHAKGATPARPRLTEPARFQNATHARVAARTPGTDDEPLAPEAAPTEQDAAMPADAIASEDYVLELNVPLHHQSEHDAALVREFEDAAFGVGLPLEVAQGAVDAMVDAGIALGHRRGDGISMESAEADLNAAVGEKAAASIIKNAQHNARELGLREYLDRPGPDGRMPGNDVGVLLVLANAGVYRMTKQEAETKLAEWTASPEYRRGDPHAIVAVRMLGSRVYKSDGATPKKMLADAVKDAKRAEASAKASADRNKEASEILAEMKKGGAAAEAANRRWIELVARIA
jgi:hypothetical protein